MKLLIVFLIAASVHAACLTVEADQITAQDLVRVFPGLAALPGELVIGATPVPGVQRVLTGPQISAWANSHGVSLEETRDICVEVVTETLTKERIVEVMRTALEPDVDIEVAEYSRYAVPRGELNFPLNGLASATNMAAAPVHWRGYVKTGTGRNYPVWARVKVSRVKSVVVPTRDIGIGRTITAEDVAVDERPVFPTAAVIADLRSAIGRVARTPLRIGQAISEAQLRASDDVSRGSEVGVEVRRNQARLHFTAVAETSGMAGKTVIVKNPQTGRRFSGIVSGPGQVLVDLSDK